MSRMPADPVGRLAVLEAARAEVEAGLVLNFAEMAKVVGLTDRGLKLIVDADPNFPVKVRGDMGVPWQLDAAEVLDHLIAQARAAQAQREARRAEVDRLSGLGTKPDLSSPGDPAPAGPGSASARAMFEEAKALDALLNVQAKVRAEKERQNALLERGSVQDFLWRWLSTLQSRVLATKNRLDKTGTLPPDLRSKLDDELALILVDMRAGLEAEIERQNAPRH